MSFFRRALLATGWMTMCLGVSVVVAWGLLRLLPSSPRSPYAGVAAATVVSALGLWVLRYTATHRRRRLAVSSWRRLTRWEFWPMWAFYPPVLAYIACLAVKHRSLTVFTTSNPAIDGGGFVGESKSAILQRLAGAREFVARAHLLSGDLDVSEKLARAREFMTTNALSYPIVLKPDQGQRGSGVVVARSPEALERALARSRVDTIVQEYVSGPEFGVFYYRYPAEAAGHLFSITEKRLPTVVGDGRRTLEALILDDDRAVCAARLYCERHRDRLHDVPAPGEVIGLAELGTHSRGAVFLDGDWVRTPALERRFDEIARRFDGFFFGRFDVRAAGGIEAFRQGEGFKILELNGVTSEATHIYHPGTPLRAAYRVLMRQWQIAFEIGAANRQAGAGTTPLLRLFALARDYRRTAEGHLDERAAVSD